MARLFSDCGFLLQCFVVSLSWFLREVFFARVTSYYNAGWRPQQELIRRGYVMDAFDLDISTGQQTIKYKRLLPDLLFSILPGHHFIVCAIF